MFKFSFYAYFTGTVIADRKNRFVALSVRKDETRRRTRPRDGRRKTIDDDGNDKIPDQAAAVEYESINCLFTSFCTHGGR